MVAYPVQLAAKTALTIVDVRAFDESRWWVQFSDDTWALFTAEQWRAYEPQKLATDHRWLERCKPF